MRHALLLATALTIIGTNTGGSRPACAEAPFTLAGTPGQLPKTVVPSAYVIDIVADMHRLALSGHESITVSATGAGDSIVLNQAGLTLSRATVDGVPAAITQDEAAQTATLRLPHPLADGAHTLHELTVGTRAPTTIASRAMLTADSNTSRIVPAIRAPSILMRLRRS